MKVYDLHQQIKNNTVLNFYIFAGSETGIAEKYIHRISNVANKPIERVDDVRSCIDRISRNTLLVEPRLFVIQDDKEFMRAESMWKTISKQLKYNTLILLYTKLDPRLKFFKNNDYVPFEKQTSDILADSILKVVNLSRPEAVRLAEICDCSYDRIMLEADKIKAYTDSQLAAGINVTPDVAFRQLLEIDAIYKPVSDVTYKFIDAIMNRNNLKAIQQSMLYIRNQRESRLGALTLLYNNFRIQLMYQSLGANVEDAKEKTGLTVGQCKMAKYRSGRYSVPELKRALDILQDLEYCVKTGQIEEDISLDYFVAQVI